VSFCCANSPGSGHFHHQLSRDVRQYNLIVAIRSRQTLARSTGRHPAQYGMIMCTDKLIYASISQERKGCDPQNWIDTLTSIFTPKVSACFAHLCIIMSPDGSDDVPLISMPSDQYAYIFYFGDIGFDLDLLSIYLSVGAQLMSLQKNKKPSCR